MLIVGAGPSGMAAAVCARRHGMDVSVIDDQPAPGGQIWRSIELTDRRDEILGSAFTEGRSVARAFRASGASYSPGAQLWQLESGFKAFVSQGGKAELIEADNVILATGAQERPVPFPGWTLPGVLTVGAAQILLKSAGQIPAQPVWMAGSGPLPLLYAVQLLKAGGMIAGYLDTTPSGQWQAALRHLSGAIRAWREVAKGLGWIATLRRSGIHYVSGVSAIEASGDGKIEALRYQTGGGRTVSVVAGILLVHEGVVPSIHTALSLNCRVEWDGRQDCFTPVLDAWGESTQANLFIAGDGAGIAGAKAALLRGELAALRIAVKLGRIDEAVALRAARPIRRALEREYAVRPFLDALFRPRREVFEPTDQTVICRCEEIKAGEVRALARIGRPGPNQVKAATRAGMGPCQGRQCGYTITRLLAAAQQRLPADVGFFNIRPPLKPVTLGEVASVDAAVTP